MAGGGRRGLVLDVLVIAACVVALSTFGVSIVCGGSMEPGLSRGDLLVYRRGPMGVSPGLLVLLGRPRHEYVHRVVRVTSRGTIVTRGDANPIPDREETAVASVRGTVVAVVPTGRALEGLASSER